MADCTPGARYSLRGAAAKVTNLRNSSVWQIGFEPLPTNHEWAEWLCALLHSLLASRLTVIPKIPLDPRRSRMAP